MRAAPRMTRHDESQYINLLKEKYSLIEKRGLLLEIMLEEENVEVVEGTINDKGE
jgi:hypothetical protein